MTQQLGGVVADAIVILSTTKFVPL